MMKQLQIFTFTFLIFISSLPATSFKKYSGEFLSLGAGSRAMGMAGAFVSVANDVSAGYWNPAGLTETDSLEILFMHTKQFISSVQHNFIAASMRLNAQSTLAVSFMYLTVNGIKDTRDAYNFAEGKIDHSRIQSFNTGDYAFYISYARMTNRQFSYGFNIKLLERDYKIESAIGIGFDVGLKYRLTDKLMIGAMFRDITTSLMTWSTGERELISPSLRTGASYLVNISPLNLTLLPSLDLNWNFEGRQYASQFQLGAVSLDALAGMEVVYHDLLAVRLGLDDLQRFNTGIGLRIPRISFDYSFTAYQSELDDIHRISFHLNFDRTLF